MVEFARRSRARRDRRRRPRLRAGRPLGDGTSVVDARAGTAGPLLRRGRDPAGAGRGPRRPSRWGSPGSATPGMHQNQDFGNALRYPDDLNPGGWDAKERLAVMDARGHRHRGALLRPRPVARRHSPTSTSRSRRHQVWNDWIAEWTVDRSRAARRHRGDPAPRPRGRGGARCTAPRRSGSSPASSAEPGERSCRCGHRDSTRCTRRSQGTGMPLGLHGAGLYDIDGVSKRMIDLMAMGTHHALILFMDQYMTLAGLVYGGVFERHPTLKVAGARVRRRLDRALDGPLRRVPRGLRAGRSPRS